MICNKCNEEISDSSKFCPNCGNKITDDKDNTIQEIKTETEVLNPTKLLNNKKKYKIFIGTLIIVVLGIGIFFAAHNKSKTQSENNKIATITSTPAEVKVPKLKDSSIDDAKRTIESNKLKVGKITEEYNDYVPTGRIIDQQPAEGTSIRVDSPIDLVVSKGKNEDTKTSSEITKEQAVEIIQNFIPTGSFEYDRDENKNGAEYYVIRQFSKGAGTTPTVDWFYVDKKNGYAFKWNLADSTLVRIQKDNVGNKNSNTKEPINQDKSNNKNKPYSGHWMADNYYTEIHTMNGQGNNKDVPQKPYECYFIDNENTIAFKQDEDIKVLHYHEDRQDNVYMLNVNEYMNFGFADGKLVEMVKKLDTPNESITWMIGFKYVDDKQSP